jgi:drug/metabolite transporter (DMT)-like permease
VVSASVFAWVLLGEALSPLQFLGGALILGGIASVRAERPAEAVAVPAFSTPHP